MGKMLLITKINLDSGKVYRNQKMKNMTVLCNRMLHLLCHIVKWFVMKWPFHLKKFMPNLKVLELHFHFGMVLNCPHIFSLNFQHGDLNLSK